MQKLGKGAYAVVFKATEKKTKEVVAMKKIFDAFQNATDAQRTFREIMYLQALAHREGEKEQAHPNIIRLRNFLKAENDKDIVRCALCLSLPHAATPREKARKSARSAQRAGRAAAVGRLTTQQQQQLLLQQRARRRSPPAHAPTSSPAAMGRSACHSAAVEPGGLRL
jgi:serine/threonine protein kinase